MIPNVSLPTTRKIQAVVIDRTDGNQTKLTDADNVYAPGVGPVALGSIPDVLSREDGWIEYETAAEWVAPDGAEREPWQQEAEPMYKARARIYARSVVECMIVYDEPA